MSRSRQAHGKPAVLHLLDRWAGVQDQDVHALCLGGRGVTGISGQAGPQLKYLEPQASPSIPGVPLSWIPV